MAAFGGRLRCTGRLCGEFRDALGFRPCGLSRPCCARTGAAHRLIDSGFAAADPLRLFPVIDAEGIRLEDPDFLSRQPDTVSAASTFSVFRISDRIPHAAAAILARMLDLKPREASWDIQKGPCSFWSGSGAEAPVAKPLSQRSPVLSFALPTAAIRRPRFGCHGFRRRLSFAALPVPALDRRGCRVELSA